jgi:short subunit dehydrogenase-like uncharacterized protein
VPGMSRLLVYGATGYSGGLVVEEACRLGLAPIVAGRDRMRVAAVAERLRLEHRVASLTDGDGLEAMLRQVGVVVHAAGPFSRTAAPMVEACLRRGVHYLDLTGEARVVEAVAQRHAEARRRGVMLMPAVGFEALPSDCLAAHVSRRLPAARSLAVATTVPSFITRGSAETLLALDDGGVARRGGVLMNLPVGTLERTFDFGRGPQQALSCGLVDVVTAWYTTGVPDITGYLEAVPRLRAAVTATRLGGWLLRAPPVQAWLRAWAALLPDGPSASERDAHRMAIVAEGETASGHRVVARMQTPGAYTVTGATAAAVAGRVLAGDVEPGFQTPGRIWGPDLVFSIPGVEREDVE